jgi:peptidyl-prolyl cis-trans isomerase A (cyclophilin A)
MKLVRSTMSAVCLSSSRARAGLAAVVAAALLSVPAFAQGTAPAKENAPATNPANAPAATTPAKPTPASAQPEQPKKPDAAAPGDGKDKSVGQMEYVRVATTMGDIFIELDGVKAPISVENFLKYVDSKHYDGTIFHRVIPTFMVQGGGFDDAMKQKPTNAPIQNEWQNGLKNIRGSVAAARSAVANSATSQFFINLVDNAFLDQPRDGAGYAVFGRVVTGMDVVDKIKNLRTGTKNGYQDVPLQTVKIASATRCTRDEALKGSVSEEKK